MKTFTNLFLFLIFQLLFIPLVISQSKTDSLYRKHIIKISPIKILLQDYNFSYELLFKKKISIELGVSYILGDFLTTLYSYNNEARGYSFTLGTKFYFKTIAPKGWYQKSQLRYKYIEFINQTLSWGEQNWALGNVDIFKNVLSLKYLLGYQIVLLKHFIIDVYSGIGIRYVHRKNHYYSIYRSGHSGWDDYTAYYDNKVKITDSFLPCIALGFNLGFVF